MNRLPKAEKSNPTVKKTVRKQERRPDPMEVEVPRSHQPTSPHKSIPALDNESLHKILRLAGPATILRARSVNQQWRNVATDIINNFHAIEFSRLFPNIPTSAIVHSTLKVFSHVERITIRDWPYTHVYPCIADELTVVDLPRLKEVELTGVHVTPKAVGFLVRRDSVRYLTLGNHDSLNRAAVATMVRDRHSFTDVGKHLLDRLVFRKARCLDGSDISLISSLNVALDIVVADCPNVRATQLSCTRNSVSRAHRIFETYSLTNCCNLITVTINMSVGSNDCTSLNLSLCRKLRDLIFSVEDAESLGMGATLMSDLRVLNLSGCRELREISLDLNGAVVVMLARLEGLILFGARRLSRNCIQNVFGLSSTVPILPRLTTLNLTGTNIDKLVLNNYQRLMWVDVSGCPHLDSIDIRDCWKLSSFKVLGKHAPLESVSMILPVDCKVEGKRDTWHWQIQGSHQAISYP